MLPAGDAASYVSTEMQFAIIKKIDSLKTFASDDSMIQSQ